MEVEEDNTWYFVAISITAALLLASTIYTLRNIIQIWRKGAPSQTENSDLDKSKEINADETTDSDSPLVGAGDALDIDPMQYCEHIQSEVKKAKIRVAEKKIGETLTSEQIAEEKVLQRQQLEEIFNLMQAQNEKFGVGSVEDIQDQMKLYAS